jgi:hypothetical protein
MQKNGSKEDYFWVVSIRLCETGLQDCRDEKTARMEYGLKITNKRTQANAGH